MVDILFCMFHQTRVDTATRYVFSHATNNNNYYYSTITLTLKMSVSIDKHKRAASIGRQAVNCCNARRGPGSRQPMRRTS